MNIVLLGPPGSGKGTQANILIRQRSMVQLSTGDMLREARRSGTEVGVKVAAIMDAGELVTDEIVIELIGERIGGKKGGGFIFDGFPRTLAQADSLEELLRQAGMKLDAAVEMEVGLKELQDRITGRVSCGQCGAVYHKVSSPPKVEGVCDNCGARELHQRDDDTIEVLNTRLLEYYRKTAPLVGYYHHAGLLRRVDCVGGPEEVANSVAKALDG
ncbi:MAG: adenylate kinase [Rhodobacteraceae bacterium]|nr:adenylate kinase [Paracoccaceae bacterium]